MTKSQKTVLIILALVVLGGLIYFGYNNPSIINPDSSEPTAEDSENNEPSGEEVAPGSSLVNEEGDVVNEEGDQTRNDADINDSDAPRQSAPISEDEISEESLRLEVSASGFAPSEFSVNSGDAVTIAITSTDEQTHIFKFKDESMKGVAVGIAPGETRSITFNAPASGSYDFYCDVPGHEGRGETGTMTVN